MKMKNSTACNMSCDLGIVLMWLNCVQMFLNNIITYKSAFGG